MKENEKRSGVAGGEPWVAGSRRESGRPIQSAVQSSVAVGSGHVINLKYTNGLDGDRLSVKSAQKKAVVGSDYDTNLVGTDEVDGQSLSVKIHTEDEMRVSRCWARGTIMIFLCLCSFAFLRK